MTMHPFVAAGVAVIEGEEWNLATPLDALTGVNPFRLAIEIRLATMVASCRRVSGRTENYPETETGIPLIFATIS